MNVRDVFRRKVARAWVIAVVVLATAVAEGWMICELSNHAVGTSRPGANAGEHASPDVVTPSQ